LILFISRCRTVEVDVQGIAGHLAGGEHHLVVAIAVVPIPISVATWSSGGIVARTEGLPVWSCSCPGILVTVVHIVVLVVALLLRMRVLLLLVLRLLHLLRVLLRLQPVRLELVLGHHCGELTTDRLKRSGFKERDDTHTANDFKKYTLILLKKIYRKNRFQCCQADNITVATIAGDGIDCLSTILKKM